MILKRMMVCQVNILHKNENSFFFQVFYIFTGIESDDLDMNRLATAPKPGTTLRPETVAKNPQQQSVSSRPKTLSGRPLTGMVNEWKLNQCELNF